MSGLTCATRLRDAGFHVHVFDKSRGTGGRLSTRRAERTSFDHGAQYFTVRDPEFASQVARWERDGVVGAWSGRIANLEAGIEKPCSKDSRRLVGVPGMSSLARHLATGLTVTTEFRVTRLVRTFEDWTLVAADGSRAYGFDTVVLAAPAPQTAEIARAVAPHLADAAHAVSFAPCLASMLEYDSALDFPFDAAFVENSPLSWIARNSSKPGRSARESWVLHASPEWSERHFEDDPAEVQAAMATAFATAVGRELPPAVAAQFHRWKFALPLNPIATSYLYDPNLQIAACGDWCAGPRVEGAFLSGAALADRLLETSHRSSTADVREFAS